MAKLIDGGPISWDDDGKMLDSEGKVIEKFAMCDWREHPDSVATSINGLLKEHGLEIMSYDTESDFYAFAVRKKQ